MSKGKRKGDIGGNAGKQPRITEKTLRQAEGLASFGLILVAAGLIAPIVTPETSGWLTAFKWIYAVGALLYTIARVIGACDRTGGFRIRRLHRMEVWAGFAFIFGAAFWFYRTWDLPIEILTNKMLSDTIVFTMVGALIQIIASWMLGREAKRQRKAEEQNKS